MIPAAIRRATGALGLFAVLATGAACTETEGFPAFRHEVLYDRLKGYAEAFTLRDGDWKEDFGDSAFYGPAFYAHAGLTGYDQPYSLRAEAAHKRNLQVLREENLVTGDANELIMAALGAIEYIAATGDHVGDDNLDYTMGGLDFLLGLFGGYIEPDVAPGYAMDNYGPTSVNGLIALVFLQHAYMIGDAEKEAYLAVGRGIADRVRQRHWTGEYFAFSDEREGLFLYPNITLALLNARLFQLTGEEEYREQALEIYEAIQPLRVQEDSGLASPGRYRSPYSAETMGAQSDDYTTLSSQNYTMLVLALLYEITGELAYVHELDGLLDFVEDQLIGEWCLGHLHREPCAPVCLDDEPICVAAVCEAERCQPGVLHHWIDNRLADHNDTEFFCSGCSLQTLFLLWYRQEVLPSAR